MFAGKTENTIFKPIAGPWTLSTRVTQRSFIFALQNESGIVGTAMTLAGVFAGIVIGW